MFATQVIFFTFKATQIPLLLVQQQSVVRARLSGLFQGYACQYTVKDAISFLWFSETRQQGWSDHQCLRFFSFTHHLRLRKMGSGHSMLVTCVCELAESIIIEAAFYFWMKCHVFYYSTS